MNKPQMFSGYHAVEALLRHRPEAVLELFVLDARADRGEERLDQLVETARSQGIAVQRARKEVLAKHAGPQNQGVVARARPRRPGQERQLFDLLDQQVGPVRLLVLDGVTDPHNLGACLRSADATGVTAVVVPRRGACGLTPVVCRTAVGAAESLPYYEVGNLTRALDELRAGGIQVVGTDLADRSVSLGEFQPQPSVAVIMGAEGQGMREQVRQRCDVLVYIPMQGEVQSLNVSVATGVVLYQLSLSR